MTDRERRGSGFSSGFFLGGLIGAALVFLFTTEEGKKIKDLLAKKGKEVIDDLPEIIKDLEKKGEEFAQKTEEVKRKLEKRAKELSSETKKKIESSLSHIEETQERGRQAAAIVRKRFFTKKGKKLG
jgi:gas vesicle protein